MTRLWRQYGVRHGIFRGFLITCLRDVPAFGLYFASYHVCRDYFVQALPSSDDDDDDDDDDERHGGKLCIDSNENNGGGGGVLAEFPSFRESLPMLLAGGLAGVLSWVICIPFDVVKSCVQGEILTGNAGDAKSAAYYARQGYAREGLGFFTRGMMATVLRAGPVSAVTFYVYELMIRVLPNPRAADDPLLA